MEPKALPVQYHLEIYERSFVNDPSWTLQTTSPLSHFSVGDLLDPRTFGRWYTTPAPGEMFRVKAVVHWVWEVENSHVGHKVGICVEAIRAPE